QLTLLTHAKENLRSTLSQQTLEVDHLKGEFKEGLQNIIQKLGIEESGGIKKPADVAGLLLVLEKSIQGIVLDRENTRFKLVETQKVAKDLSSCLKILFKVGQVPVGKLVPSAAQMRSLRKGSNDQLAITNDSKSHMFKSLNTSGLVPVQGKMIADRVDGICTIFHRLDLQSSFLGLAQDLMYLVT
nr:hypothetical protein [Tanacetum cinerariifolium]